MVIDPSVQDSPVYHGFSRVALTFRMVSAWDFIDDSSSLLITLTAQLAIGVVLEDFEVFLMKVAAGSGI